MLPRPFFAGVSYTPAQNASPFASGAFSTRTRTRTLYVTSGSYATDAMSSRTLHS